MGNLQGWGGPLTRHWLEQQAALQMELLQRMRSLDMMPVLAGFDGYVPDAVKLHYPNARINASGSWAGFPAEFQFDDLLDPTDPLFHTIGSTFMKNQIARFGTDSLYNSDTYNEMNPPTNDPAYLAAISSAVYAAMAAVDPAARWMMQGWLFVSDPDFWQPAQVEAYLGSVPNDRMIILDLMSDVDPVYPRTNLYYNKSYVWNMSAEQSTHTLTHIHTRAPTIYVAASATALSALTPLFVAVASSVAGFTISVATTA